MIVCLEALSVVLSVPLIDLFDHNTEAVESLVPSSAKLDVCEYFGVALKLSGVGSSSII